MNTDDVKVTKLPPGAVSGAGDIHHWAARRRVGLSGAVGARKIAGAKSLARQPKSGELYNIYLDMGYCDFCEYGGLAGEGRRLALAEWKRRTYGRA